MKRINLLVTLDEKYLPQLQILLTSIAVNNIDAYFDLFLLHKDIPDEKLKSVKWQCEQIRYGFFPIKTDIAIFDNAPVTKQYPREMYYRLLAPHLLPERLDRILYLDPDILVINPLAALWEVDMENKIFAAAAHTGYTEFSNNMNRVRLKTTENYFNTGVLLIDLNKARKEVDPDSIFHYIEHHDRELVLPDQDVFNALYGNRTLELDDYIWNYDARCYNRYLMRSTGTSTIDWIMQNTAILHFCGKAKPWKPNYPYRFGILYKHYTQIFDRMKQEINVQTSVQ